MRAGSFLFIAIDRLRVNVQQGGDLTSPLAARGAAVDFLTLRADGLGIGTTAGVAALSRTDSAEEAHRLFQRRDHLPLQTDGRRIPELSRKSAPAG
jgi:hypothetical protein